MCGGGWIKCHEIGTVAGGIVFKQKGKKERVALINTQQQFALEKRKNYVESICEMMTRAGHNGVQLGSPCLRQQKKENYSRHFTIRFE